MKTQRLIIIAAALVMIVIAVKSNAANFNMEFAYPGPTANFNTVKVKSKIFIPCKSSNPQPGQVYVENC